MVHRSPARLLSCSLALIAVAGAAAAAESQRAALVVARAVDGQGEPVEGVDIRLVRCRGARRFTMMPSFEAANPTGVPVVPDRDNCDVYDDSTDADGVAKINNVMVGRTYIEAARDATMSYLLIATKDGYTRVRRLITPHPARNDFEVVVYRTAGERMFALIDEAEAAVAVDDYPQAEALMIQAVAMMQAELAVRDAGTPDVLLEALGYLAYVQLAGGNDIAAGHTLEEILSLEPRDPYALRTLGVIAVQQRDWSGAAVRFEAYVEARPDSSDAQLLMGNLYLETGDLPASIEHLERSVKLDSSAAAAYRSLGTAYERVGRLQDAVRSLEAYLELTGDPADAPHIRATLAMLRR